MSESPSQRQFGLLEKLRHRKHHHRKRGRLFRSGFALAGVAVTVVGLLMLVGPGPAFIVLPIGLYMLALEFDWAERLLHRALAHADRTRQSSFVRDTVRFVKRRPKTTAAILAVLITVVAIVLKYSLG